MDYLINTQKAWWLSLSLIYKWGHWSTKHLGDLPKIPQLVSDGVGTPTLIHLTPEFMYLDPQLRCWPTQKLYLKVGEVSRKTRKRVRCWRLNCGAGTQLSLFCSGTYSLVLPFSVLRPITDFFKSPFDLLSPTWFPSGIRSPWRTLTWTVTIWLNQGLWRDIEMPHFILLFKKNLISFLIQEF